LHQSLRALTDAIAVSLGVFIDDKGGYSSQLRFAHIDLRLGYSVLASTRHMWTDLAQQNASHLDSRSSRPRLVPSDWQAHRRIDGEAFSFHIRIDVNTTRNGTLQPKGPSEHHDGINERLNRVLNENSTSINGKKATQPMG
jgi:hypothetical protein